MWLEILHSPPNGYPLKNGTNEEQCHWLLAVDLLKLEVTVTGGISERAKFTSEGKGIFCWIWRLSNLKTIVVYQWQESELTGKDKLLLGDLPDNNICNGKLCFHNQEAK